MKFDKDEQGYFEFIELFFFAYRDFTAEADGALLEYGFGRAHHRTLYFVSRNPGLRVSELLDILKVTKQSLNRVLKQLISEEFVYQEQGTGDRRRRHLFLTPKGEALTDKLRGLQFRRISTSLEGFSPEAYHNICDGLFSLIDKEDKPDVIGRLSRARKRNKVEK